MCMLQSNLLVMRSGRFLRAASGPLPAAEWIAAVADDVVAPAILEALCHLHMQHTCAVSTEGSGV